MANRYRSKTLQGLQGQFFVSSAAPAGDATFEAFRTTAEEGEMMIYAEDGTDRPGNLTPSNADNLQAGEKFFIAQLIDGKVKRSQLLAVNNCTISSKAYAAGSKHKVVVSAMPDPAIGDDLSVSVIETTPTQEPFPTWFYDQRASSTVLYAQLSSLVQKINDASNKANESDGRFVNGDILTSSAGGTFGAGTETLAVTNGSTAVTQSAGAAGFVTNDWISIHGSLYQAVLVSGTAITLDRPYAGATEAAVANANVKDQTGTMPAASTLSLELEALNLNEHFTIAICSTWADGGAVITTTPFVKSSGTATQMLDFEYEGEVWEGFRTSNRAFGDEFGRPTSQVDVATPGTYDIYTIKYKTSQKSVMAPLTEDSHIAYVNIAVSNASAKTWLGYVFANFAS